MPVIGVAEILVRPTFTGAQRSVGRELDGIANAEGPRAGQTIGSRMGSTIGKGIKLAGAATVVGAGAFLATALTKGFGRLQAIENAKASLTGLGHSAESVTEIMNNASASVKGTAFGLGDAATVAATMVAAGIKPGKDLEKTLTLVGDAATIAGTDIGSMGGIFAKAAASNKIQMDVINQLHDAGVPALAFLAEQMGVTAEEASKMASAGKIDFKTFETAMTKGLGGAAQESGKTLEGAFKNTMAAVGRIGANLLEGVYPKIQAFFAGAIDWLKPFEEGAKVAGEAIGNFLNDGLSAAKGIIDILFKGDFTGGIFGLEEDSGFVDFLFNVRESFQKLSAFVVDDMIPALKDFGGWVVDNKDWLLSLAVGVGSMVLAFKLWTGALAAWRTITVIATGVQAAFNLVMSANPIGIIILAIVGLVAGLTYFFTQTETGKKIVEVAFAAIKAAVAAVVDWWNGTLIPALQSVGQWFKDVWDGAAGAVQTAVKWIQDAIGNVVGWIQQNWGLLLTIILGPLGFIIQWVVKNWSQISDTVKTVFDAVAGAFTWLYETIIKPVFDSIMVVVGGFVAFFQGVAQLIAAVFILHIAPAFQNFYNGVIMPVFDGIRNFIAAWWAATQLVFTTVINFVKTVFSAAFTWLRDSVITPVFNFIRNAISVWWAATKFIFDTAIGFIRTVFSAAFTWLRDFVITPVFNGIKNAITVWWTGVKFIFDTVVGFIRGTLSAAFTWFRDNVISPVFNGVRDKIKWVWEKGIKPVFDLLSNAIKKDVPNAFQKGVDGIKSIWETIREISKKPVRFLVDTVINGGIIGAFNKLAGFIDPGGKIVKKLGPVALPKGFRNGGYTGKGRPGEFAGHVHRDEQVIKSPSRRSIEGAAPGFLDALNNHGASALAGFNGSGESRLGLFGGFSRSIANAGRVFVRDRAAGWDVPGAIRAWQGVSGLKLAMGNGSPGINVTAAPMNVPGWGRGGYGYSTGPEVTVNSYQSGMAAGMKRAVVAHEIGHSLGLAHINSPASIMHPAVATAQWPTGFDLASMRMAYGAPGAGAKRYGPGDAGVSFPKSPFDGLAESLMGKLKSAFPGGGMFLDAAVGMAKMGIDKVMGFFKDIAGNIGKKIAGVAGSVLDGIKGILGFAGPAGGAQSGAHLNPLLYDQGGILRPGLSSIMNATGKPEAIYTNEQNRALQALATRGMSPGGDTWNVQLPERASVGELMDAVSFKQRVNSRGGARR